MSFLLVALKWAEGGERSPIPLVCDKEVYHKSHSETSSAGYIWEGTITDLIELAIAIYNIKLIRKASGELITFAEIIHALKLIFGIKIPKNIYSRKTRTMERKKNASPFLERMLVLYRHEVKNRYV